LFYERETMKWLVVHLRADREYQARDELENHYPGKVYLPEVERDRRRKGKNKSIMEPLFPAYLFLKVGDDEDWSMVTKSRNTIKIVKFGDYAPCVDDNFINDFMHYDRTMKVDYEKGDAIFINSEAFINVPAIVKLPGRERIGVLADILGVKRTLMVNRTELSIEPI